MAVSECIQSPQRRPTQCSSTTAKIGSVHSHRRTLRRRTKQSFVVNTRLYFLSVSRLLPERGRSAYLTLYRALKLLFFFKKNVLISKPQLRYQVMWTLLIYAVP